MLRLTGVEFVPYNLIVEVQDFNAIVRWNPAPQNPGNCTYVVELQEFGYAN